MANLPNMDGKMDMTQTPHIEEIYVPIELFQDQLFTTDKTCKKVIGGIGSDAYIEDLFSIPQEEINTPFTKWLISNRQNIIDANRSYFGYLLLSWARAMPNRAAIYKRTPKVIVKAIIRTQTYVNYAKNPESGFINALIMPEECLNLIQQARTGRASNYELFNYLQALIEEAKQYEDFWNIEPDIETLKRLSGEMMEAAKQSVT